MFENFTKTRVLVIGDMLVDKYISGKITKVSFEAPIPVVEVIDTELKMGGASLVIENASRLGAKVSAVGVIGNDEIGRTLKNRFTKLGVKTEGLVVDSNFKTPLRTRVTVDKYQVSRFDDSLQKLENTTSSKIIQRFKLLVKKVDCIVICDYGMGTLTDNIIKSITEITTKSKKKVVVSPVENHLKYNNKSFVFRIKLKDAVRLLGIKPEEHSDEDICKMLHDLLKCDRIILTKGDGGITTYENGNVEDIFPTRHIARDITSVGEVLVAVFAVSYASGYPFEKSCVIGNIAAGTVVEKFGSKNITREELEKSHNEYYEYMMQK